MKIIFSRSAVLIFALTPLLLRAGGDEVVVIYNSRVPESKAVAEYYAKARQVPTNQIYGFALTPNEEESRAEFRDSLQLPLAKKLEEDGLWKFAPVTYPAANGQPERTVSRVVASKIRYAVLCYGVPLKIMPDVDLEEPNAEKVQVELRRNEAAVDSELAWLPLIKMGVPLTGPIPNWLYGSTNAALFNPTNGILLVSRLDGPSADIARGLVDKAMQAERDGLWGRAYFDARGLPKTDNYYLGDEWILGAANFSRASGFETVIDDKPGTFSADFPMSQIAIYCGWYDGTVSGPFTLPKVEFMPGAFACHLHSFSSGILRTTNNNWCGPLLAKGVTCTMGCVYEPYLSALPNVEVFLERLVAGQFTFGEAAWASQRVLSWQTAVIGDPLYQPFGKSPVELHAQLARDHNPLIEWAQLRIVNLHLIQGAPLAQAVTYLENIPVTMQSAVLTEKLADLYEMQDKPFSAIEAYQNALKLNPSPEQSIRIRLALGEKLMAQGRTADAIDNYKQLLAGSPEYPGKGSVLEKLVVLEQKIIGTNTPANRKF